MFWTNHVLLDSAGYTAGQYVRVKNQELYNPIQAAICHILTSSSTTFEIEEYKN